MTIIPEKAFLENLGITAKWLDSSRAGNAYTFATSYESGTGYSFSDSRTVNNEVKDTVPEGPADSWLRSRVQEEKSFQVIFSRNAVCVIDADDFFNSWPDILFGRDAIIISNTTKTIIYSCHEGFLEIAERSD